jgi:hypothetical protein
MSYAKNIAKTTGLIGAGIGLALYAVFGLMQSVMLGGTAGVLMSGEIYGPGTFEVNGGALLARVIVGGGMLSGALVALVMFVVAGAVVGAVPGYLVGLLIKGKDIEVPHEKAGKA